MKKTFVLSFIFFVLSVLNTIVARNIATEVRAVWLTTNWALDWPNLRLSEEEQKSELCEILDKLHTANFNTVFFQVRIRGDVFYKSAIEPMSPFAKHNFDPFTFAIEECHKRGLECHAWFVTFPVGTKKQVAAHGRNSIVKRKPDICKFYNGEWYLDPGNPETHTYLSSLVEELTTNYNLDGIHFDYIRYPERAAKFPDQDTYKKYGDGLKLSDWRRENINKLVSGIYKLVKGIKPWVQVSSSPVGKYRSLDYHKGGWTAYESVFQDACYWMQTGIHDALYPMMYYKDENFYPYLTEWVKNSNGRIIVPGLGAYQMLPKQMDWSLQIITDQIDFIRENNVHGEAYFRTKNITGNLKGIYTALTGKYYTHPAKLPHMHWLDSISPEPPVNLEAVFNPEGKLQIKWEPPGNPEDYTYTVYISNENIPDIQNPVNIFTTNLRNTSLEIEIEQGEYGKYYSVTASNRFHNESVPCVSAFVIHSPGYEK